MKASTDGLTKAQILHHSKKIAVEYKADGFKLNIRQIYYRFIGLGLVDRAQLDADKKAAKRFYKHVVATLSEARLNGTFPIDMIEDRGRDAEAGDFLQCDDDVDHALVEGARIFKEIPEICLQHARWHGQPTFVSVFVEKEALGGLFEGPCNDLGVGLFACRGYPSVSSLFQWLKHLEEAVIINDCSEAVVLYFGDHDPDGLEIPRALKRNLTTLIHGMDQDTEEEFFPRLKRLNFDQRLQIDRVALTMAQVKQYNLPPFSAKEDSVRYQSYVDECGHRDAWELDALDPKVLRKMIHNEVGRHFDPSIFKGNHEAIVELRKEMHKRMMKKGWLKAAVGNGEER